VALVVDDLVTTTPWTPRFVRVYGSASVTQREGDSAPSLRITPTVSWSWNLDGQSFPAAGNAKPKKSVHNG
jgi:pyridoxamine 5'-phosphate oxidase family protein